MARRPRGARIDLDALNAAISEEYLRQHSTIPEIDQSVLLDMLQKLQQDSPSATPIVDYVYSKVSDRQLSDLHYGTLMFLTEGCQEVFSASRFPAQVAARMQVNLISLCRVAIAENLVALVQNHPVLTIADNLVRYCIGIADSGERLQEAVTARIDLVQDALQLLMNSDTDARDDTRAHLMDVLAKDLESHIQEELTRVDKLEHRLIETEMGMMKANRSRGVVAAMLNQKLNGEQLPAFIHEFIAGPWFDSLQLIVTRRGLESPDWAKVAQLTGQLIESLQQPEPGESSGETAPPVIEEDGPETMEQETSDETQEQPVSVPAMPSALYELAESLPPAIEKNLVSLEHDQQVRRVQVERIEVVHLALMSGEPVARSAWVPLETHGVQLETAVSQDLLSQVNEMVPGQWFAYLGTNNKMRHIKLVLKVNELQQLLFTNRNGQKVLQPTFDEFAYFLSSGAAVPLPKKGAIGRTLRRRLNEMVARQLSRMEEKKAIERERQEADRLEGFKPLRLLKSVRDHSGSSDEYMAEHVDELRDLPLGSWIRLTHPTVGRVDGKMAVKFPDHDRVILVDRTGLNLGEYYFEILDELIQLGGCEVLESEPPDELAEAVTRMRETRELAASR